MYSIIYADHKKLVFCFFVLTFSCFYDDSSFRVVIYKFNVVFCVFVQNDEFELALSNFETPQKPDSSTSTSHIDSAQPATDDLNISFDFATPLSFIKRRGGVVVSTAPAQSGSSTNLNQSHNSSVMSEPELPTMASDSYSPRPHNSRCSSATPRRTSASQNSPTLHTSLNVSSATPCHSSSPQNLHTLHSHAHASINISGVVSEPDIDDHNMFFDVTTPEPSRRYHSNTRASQVSGRSDATRGTHDSSTSGLRGSHASNESVTGSETSRRHRRNTASRHLPTSMTTSPNTENSNMSHEQAPPDLGVSRGLDVSTTSPSSSHRDLPHISISPILPAAHPSSSSSHGDSSKHDNAPFSSSSAPKDLSASFTLRTPRSIRRKHIASHSTFSPRDHEPIEPFESDLDTSIDFTVPAPSKKQCLSVSGRPFPEGLGSNTRTSRSYSRGESSDFGSAQSQPSPQGLLVSNARTSRSHSRGESSDFGSAQHSADEFDVSSDFSTPLPIQRRRVVAASPGAWNHRVCV